MLGLAGCCAVASGCAQTVIPVDASDESDAVDAVADDGCHAGIDATQHAAQFVGSVLGSGWDTRAVGNAPAYDLDGGWLSITDASLADTPSSGGTRSWIYDPTVDLGNQMTWDQPIGTADFDLTFDIAWSSTIPQLTLAGVGLSNAEHQLEVYGGFVDPWVSQLGTPFVRVRGAVSPADWYGDTALAGQGTLRFTRLDGVVTLSFDGRQVLRAQSRAAIRYVSVFAVRHRDPQGTYDFGRVALRGLDVCY